ncbi:DUF938 domain-containing protein [Parvularcula sp. LCG005]|uniref:DUF938 domain-containing protein n=1 Tax=Parvularcula sp. LCG005 TaxID=3078805 RepID=UPI00294251CD|nr:DUF938 domain-containing protein [Parvularcula sp. LCG005]WOI52712.1 DUF938 domain-containing protein [Parvularcula sp. LCG005]
MKDNQRGADGHEIALEARQATDDRLHSPSVARNWGPIVEAFGELMPVAGHVLELGSGTGEHAARLCVAYPDLRWQPSDPDATSRRSIASWASSIPDGRMAPPLDIRADDTWWTSQKGPTPDAIVSINMIHIAPWAAAEGLFHGAGQVLASGGRVFLYGPFKRHGATAESNLRFDADLKRRNPDWGVRDLDAEIAPLAHAAGFTHMSVRDMPANNLSVCFVKD